MASTAERSKHRERLLRQISGEDIDRVPCIGGWFHGAENLATLVGITIEQYLANPLASVIKANQRLGVDAMVPPIVPTDVEQVRTGHVLEDSFKSVTPETLLDRSRQIPDKAEQVLSAKFNAVDVEGKYRQVWEFYIKAFDEIILLPTHWEATPNFMMYSSYGYENYLSAIAFYPEAIGRIWWEDSILARARNEILAKLYREYDIPPILFCGHDICYDRGPMCSPEFLRKHYWSHARYSLEPLVDAGIRVICHCDGNVTPLIDDMIGAGFSAFQGFQYEHGVDPWAIDERRSIRNEELIFMTGMNVTRTLPFGTIDDVVEEVEYCIDYAGGGRRLLFFTSSSIGPEVPLENVLAGYRHVQAFKDFGRLSTRRQWSWALRHPETKK
jgi:hypothetical protein